MPLVRYCPQGHTPRRHEAPRVLSNRDCEGTMLERLHAGPREQDVQHTRRLPCGQGRPGSGTELALTTAQMATLAASWLCGVPRSALSTSRVGGGRRGPLGCRLLQTRRLTCLDKAAAHGSRSSAGKDGSRAAAWIHCRRRAQQQGDHCRPQTDPHTAVAWHALRTLCWGACRRRSATHSTPERPSEDGRHVRRARHDRVDQVEERHQDDGPGDVLPRGRPRPPQGRHAERRASPPISIAAPAVVVAARAQQPAGRAWDGRRTGAGGRCCSLLKARSKTLRCRAFTTTYAADAALTVNLGGVFRTSILMLSYGPI